MDVGKEARRRTPSMKRTCSSKKIGKSFQGKMKRKQELHFFEKMDISESKESAQSLGNSKASSQRDNS